MSFIAAAAAVVVVGTTVAQQDAARKAKNQAADAIAKQQADDAAATAQAQTDAANSANQLIVGQKRAQRANVLALGGTTDSTLGKPKSVLASGATSGQQAAAVQPVTSVLGGGSPLTSSRSNYS